MNISTKNIVKVLSITTLFILAIFLVIKIGWVFGWILAAFLISTILSPVANFFQKIMPWKNRGLAVFSTYILLALIIVTSFLIVLPPIVREFTSLGLQVNQWLSSPEGIRRIESLSEIIESQKSQINTPSIFSVLREASSTLASGLGSTVSAISGGIFAFITIMTLSFFMLLDSDVLVRGVAYFLPKKHRATLKRLHDELFLLVSKYFAGVLLVAITAGFVTLIPLLILGVPYAVILALLVGVTTLVPMIGATLGGGLVVLITLLSGNYFAAIVMVMFFVMYQQLENNLIIPLIQKRTVKIPPLGIIVALLIGGAVAGAFGAFLAIPAAAFVKVVFDIFVTKED